MQQWVLNCFLKNKYDCLVKKIFTQKNLFFCFLSVLLVTTTSVVASSASCSSCKVDQDSINCSAWGFGITHNESCYSHQKTTSSGTSEGHLCPKVVVAKKDAENFCKQQQKEQEEKREAERAATQDARDQIQDQLDQEKEMGQKLQDSIKEQMEKQKEKQKKDQTECTNKHQELNRQTEQTKKEVIRIQGQISQIDDEIVSISAHLTDSMEKSRDQVEKKILELRQRVQNQIKNLKDRHQQSLEGLDAEVRNLEIQLLQQSSNLKNVHRERKNLCFRRLSVYETEQERCRQKALDEIKQRREVYYASIFTGDQTFASMSDLKSASQIDAHFTKLLQQETRICYNQVVGREMQMIPCDLATLQKRDEVCKKTPPPKECPKTPLAKNTEFQLKLKLEALREQEENNKKITEDLLEELTKKMPKKRKEELERFKSDLKQIQNAFNEQHRWLINELKRVEGESRAAFIKIQSLKKRRTLLLQGSPNIRNFLNQVELVLNQCCKKSVTVTQSSCTQINSYLSDPTEMQKLSVNPLLTFEPFSRNIPLKQEPQSQKENTSSDGAR